MVRITATKNEQKNRTEKRRKGSDKSLKGKVIAITRPEKQAKKMATLIKNHGGRPLIVPTIEIKPNKNLNEIVQKIMERGEKYDFIIFTSANGASLFIDTLIQLTGENYSNFFRDSKIIAIGPKTAKEIEDRGISVVIVPKNFTSEGVIVTLKKFVSFKARALLPRASNVPPTLKKGLENLGIIAEEIPVYTITKPKNETKIKNLIRAVIKGKIDIITFTSSLTAINLLETAKKENLLKQFKHAINKEKTLTVVAIGPITQKTLEDNGIEVHLTPKKQTIESMIKLIVHHKY